MNTMTDQPAPQPDLTPQQLGQLVQAAANEVVKQLQLKARHRPMGVKGLTYLDNKVMELAQLTTLMHLHLDALTKLMVAKGVWSENDMNRALVAEFATHANELAGKPQIVVPRH